jgi:hypothetical protein
MADSKDIQPYPFQFDPSQWSNKFSPFAGRALPWPSQYAGTPTDAYGRPIQSYLDAQQAAAAQPQQAAPVTLNTSPVGANSYGLAPAFVAANPTKTPAQLAGMMDSYRNPSGGLTYGQTNQLLNLARGGGSNQGAAQQAAPAGPDMSAAYLNALANPGKIQTPGATVAQAAPPSNQSGVLQQFLQNWKPTQGAGNYSNSGFFNGLNRLYGAGNTGGGTGDM